MKKQKRQVNFILTVKNGTEISQRRLLNCRFSRYSLITCQRADCKIYTEDFSMKAQSTPNRLIQINF